MGMSQAQLARKLNKRQSLVSRVETGERSLSIYELSDWCIALEIPLDRITSQFLRVDRG